MKTKQYFGVAALSVLMACTNTSNKSTESKDSTTHKTEVVAATNINFKDAKLQSIYSSYINLKDALVASKLTDAQTASKALAAELITYSGCENTAVTAHKIENAKDIVTQRKEFTALSSDVIALFKHAELSSGTIFIQHCPMANKGDGGDWLASEKKIQNPYYGSEMMECGAVVEEIKAK
ncbi:DUF3347 domain-containing protein [Pedobacter sp. LMG 31464]|uniref:DUF3347 domain-containing protein n=1 Tax=Pedobacter planticolens TaxID=2679964 RepID=A0A923IUN9_9SPHI|nr:DUF3347 domain-containing protein [Pedobacter planticolens]MBB2144973.1 DUF3347 domain-containing protein [Pedobacter planticolens]